MGVEGFQVEPGTTESEVVEKEHISQEDFECQFKEEHSIEVKGETIPYITVVPETPTSQDWVVYIGGFSQGPSSYLDEIQNLAEAGRKVLFVNPIRGIEGERDKTQENTLDNIPEPILSKARAVQEVLNKVGATKVDFVGHSLGAAVATTLSVMNPDVVNKIVLEGSAGLLGGEDSSLRMLGRFAVDKVNAGIKDSKNIFSEEAARASKSFTNELKKDPKYRYTYELSAAAEVDIAPLLKQIKKNQKDTEVILVNANQDKVFPYDRIEKTLGENPLDEYVDRWVMYENKNASHMTTVVSRPGILRQILE